MKRRAAILGGLLAAILGGAANDGPEWVDLTGPNVQEAWRDLGGWTIAGGARLDRSDPRRLESEPGAGVLVNAAGLARNLFTRESFGDFELDLEFLIAEGSNSGVKLQGLYEIQICDRSPGGKRTGSDCGGIYPRAELLPRYHRIDDGFAPLVDAARGPGEWQKLELVFRAPRFDGAGKKVANAMLVQAKLNGLVIHDHQELPCPTGHAWRLPERRTGPLMLQADHGPVAFRNVRIRPLE
jgi:hypothetical protein